MLLTNDPLSPLDSDKALVVLGIAPQESCRRAIPSCIAVVRSSRKSKQARLHEGIRVDIGDRIKKLRVEAGMSQKDLARRAGISQATICRVESGKMRFRVTPCNACTSLERVAAVFGLGADDLLGGHD